MRFAPWLLAGLAIALPAELPAQEKEVDQSELSGLGFADDFGELALEDLIGLGEIETHLPGGRPEGIDRAPGSVAILTRNELLDLGVRSLGEAVAMLPGVDVQRDGLGRLRLFVRGVGGRSPIASSAELLVLFNGARLDEPLTGGATSINLDMPVEDVERLELLQGPASALYGSGAMAGVLLITTRLGGELSSIELSAAGGSFDTQRYHVRVSSVSGDLTLSGFVYFLDTDGPELLVPADAQTRRDLAGGGPAISLAPGLADTGRSAVETNYRVAYRDAELNFRFKRELAGNFVGAGDTLGELGDLDDKQLLIDLSWTRELGGGSLVTRAGFHDTSRFELHTAAPPGFLNPAEPLVRFPSGILYQARLRGRRLGAEAQLDLPLGLEHQVLAGASLQRESSRDPEYVANFDFARVRSLPEFQPVAGVADEQARTVVAAWVQETWRRNAWSLTGGLRLDHFGGTGASFSPRFAAVWELPSGTFLKALYGRSFRAPTLIELHYDLPGFLGNAELDPPRYDSVELAAWRRIVNLRISASAFLGFLRDPITTDGPAAPLLQDDRGRLVPPRPLVNGAGFDTRGVTVDVLKEFGRADAVSASYTWQQAEDARTGERAAGIPSHLLNVSASLRFGRHVVVTPSLVARSALPRDGSSTRPDVEGVALLNLSLRLVRLHRNFELGGVVRNLLDETWVDPAPILGPPDDYPRPGISVLLHARYTF